MSYSYDKVGNTKFITETINGTPTNTTSQQYDALNRLTVNTQGNKRVDYTYNLISQVTNKKRYSDSTGTNLVAKTNQTMTPKPIKTTSMTDSNHFLISSLK